MLVANGQRRLALDGRQGRQAALALQAQLQALARRHRVYLLLDNPQDMRKLEPHAISKAAGLPLHLRPVSDVSIVLPPAVLAFARAIAREVAARGGRP